MFGGAPEVGDVGVQPGEPPALIGSGQVRGRRLGDPQEVLTVVRGGGERLVFARLDEPLGGELADGFQQPVAQRSPGRLGQDEALVHERTEQIGRVVVARAADRLGGVEVKALGEHRQAAQQRLLGAGEQRIGLVDGRSQRLLARQGGPAPASEKPKTLVKAVTKVVQRN